LFQDKENIEEVGVCGGFLNTFLRQKKELIKHSTFKIRATLNSIKYNVFLAQF